MKKNCSDCSMAHAIEDGVFECEADKYDINTKSCFVPKLCKIEKNQRLIEHIMEFDAQGKEYDWYEQHIALIDGERKGGETEHGNTYSLGKIEMPKGAIEQIIADGERRTE